MLRRITQYTEDPDDRVEPGTGQLLLRMHDLGDIFFLQIFAAYNDQAVHASLPSTPLVVNAPGRTRAQAERRFVLVCYIKQRGDENKETEEQQPHEDANFQIAHCLATL